MLSEGIESISFIGRVHFGHRGVSAMDFTSPSWVPATCLSAKPKGGSVRPRMDRGILCTRRRVSPATTRPRRGVHDDYVGEARIVSRRNRSNSISDNTNNSAAKIVPSSHTHRTCRPANNHVWQRCIQFWRPDGIPLQEAAVHSPIKGRIRSASTRSRPCVIRFQWR